MKHGGSIAIIGMTGRFPGAPDITRFWQRIRQGADCLTYFSSVDALAAGIDVAVAGSPDYVGANGVLAQADCFDAEFFNYPPSEAEQIDPQQRVFLECAWHALEAAGYPPNRIEEPVGVFAGCGYSTYQLAQMAADRHRGASAQSFLRLMCNDKDYLTTRVSYKLNLTGPSLGIATACSTSLVAVHLACQSLLSGECDIALAGGVKVNHPQLLGHRHQEGSVMSRDGRCHPFSAEATGASAGNGAGIVVLKRLDDALADRDAIHAVILGSATNNDAGDKIGFTAPGKNGQARVIAEAQANAGVTADSIAYVETHGTGTELGDALELHALTEAFKADSPPARSCALGSVKSQIGHLDSAAGVVSLIKTALILQHGQLPPMAAHGAPNAVLETADSPFYLNEQLTDWPDRKRPRRAGVSAFGVGGSNAHVVLEEAPEQSRVAVAGSHWLPLSARNPAQLRELAERYLGWLSDTATSDVPLSDIAFTASSGRTHDRCRQSFIAASREELALQIETWLNSAAVPFTPSPEAPLAIHLDLSRWSASTANFSALSQRFAPFNAALAQYREQLDAAQQGKLAVSGGDTAVSSLRSDDTAACCYALVHLFGEALGEGLTVTLAPAYGWMLSLLRDSVPALRTPSPATGQTVTLTLRPSAEPAITEVLQLFADAYRAGATPSWASLYRQLPVSRASLPLYPFARTPYYIGPGLRTDEILTAAQNLRELLQAGRDYVHDNTAILGLEHYAQQVADLEALSGCYIAGALHELGAFPAGGEALTLDEFIHRHQLDPIQRQLWLRLLTGLTEQGGLRAEQDRFCDLQPVAAARLAELRERHQQTWAAHPVMGQMFPLLGASLAGILQGRIDLRAIYFPDGQLDQAMSVYADLPTSKFFNGLLAALVARRAQQPGTALRILEIGAGTGATTEQLLPLLPASTVEYCFTDVSSVFLRHAERRFSAYPFMRYQTFNIERTPSNQGLDENSYDLIIASNVMHVARDVRNALRHARALLKEQGLLLLYEITENSLHGDITTGLLLNPSEDSELRAGKPFMSAKQWRGAALEQGFVCCHALPDEHTPAAQVEERVLLFQAGRSTAALIGTPAPQDTADGQKQPAKTGIADHGDLYSTQWHGGHRLRELAGDLTGQSVVLVGYDPSQLDALCASLTNSGADVQSVTVTADAQQLSGDLTQCLQKASAVQFVWLAPDVSLDASIDGVTLQSVAESHCLNFLTLIEVLAQKNREPVRTTLITRHANVCHGDETSQPLAALLQGLVRVIAHGHPELNIRLRDVEAETPIEQLSLLISDAATDESWLAVRNGCYQQPRLTKLPRVDADRPPVLPEASYLLVGGTGGVGLSIAEWLAQEGARHLILASRHPDKPAAQSALARLRERGVQVELATLDVVDPRQVESLFADIQRRFPQLKGIFHCSVAGDAKDALLDTTTRLRTIFDPKVAGSWNLHQASLDLPLDFFLSCSSAVTQAPVAGVPDYAAANHFCEALMHFRRTQGLAGQAIAWGSWAEVGAVAHHPLQHQLARQGVIPLSTNAALDLLHQAMAGGGAVYGAMQMDWQRQLHRFGEAIPAYYQDVRTLAKRSSTPGGDESARQRLRRAEPAQRLGLLIGYLQDTLSMLLRLPREVIDPRANLIELGLDSLMFLEVAATVSNQLGLKVTPKDVYEHVSVQALATHFLGQLRLDQPDTATVAAKPDFYSYYQVETEAFYEPFPLTDMQQAYWLGRRADFELGNIGAHGYVELESTSWEVERLEASWLKVVHRHPMLRAIVREDGVQQVLKAPPAYNIPVLDYRDLDAETQQRHIEAIRTEMAHQVRDPSQWPLFDLRVTLLGGDRKRLHFSLDNIMLDGRSLNVFLGEWVQYYLYPDRPLPPLELTFRDYVVAAQRFRESEHYQLSWDYWRARIETLPPAPALPLATSPDQIREPRFRRHGLRLESEQWHLLKQQAAQRGLTLPGLLLACYAEVIGVWSNQQRFTLNLPTFNRLPIHPQVNQVLGEFTSILLVAIDNSAAAPFVERARNTQGQVLTDLAQGGYVSGIQVLRELARHRDGARRALMPVVFSSMFGLENDPNQFDYDFSAIDMFGEQIYGISQTPQVWLDNHLHESGGGLNIYWDEVEELFPTGLIADMFDAYCRLLRDLAASPATWDNLSPVTLPAQQLEQRRQFNATSDDSTLELLHVPFQRQAADAPLRTALICGEWKMSYGEVQARTTALASLLRLFDARPGELVAIVMDKGWEQAVAALAVLEAGAAYVPIDARLPQARVDLLLAQSGASIVLTQTPCQGRLHWPAALQVICVDQCLPAEAATSPLPTAQQLTDLAYVIYTSGSTGTPKGVMIDHCGAANTLLDINRRFDVCPQDSVLALSSLSFDLSVYDLFGVLGAGGTVVIPEPGRERDPGHWGHLIAEHQVTLWNTVPALLQMLLEGAEPTDLANAPLRQVLLSGDWIGLDLPGQLRKQWPQSTLCSLGGATEASIWSIYHPVTDVDPAWTSIPYGRPLANQHFHVLDARLNPCPDWVTGELYIGGSGLALGYWQADEQTADRFFEHPVTGERLYRTGDQGRMHPHGWIEFQGRTDFQVKIRGHRIELGEVEAAIRRQPALRDALVLATGEHRRNSGLVAYVVADPEAESDCFTKISISPDEAERRWMSCRLAAQPPASSALAPSITDPAWHQLERLFVDTAAVALRRLNALRDGQALDLKRIRQQGGIATRYEKWLRRTLSTLQSHGYVHEHDGVYTLQRSLPLALDESEWQQGLRVLKEAVGYGDSITAQIEHTIRHLPDILAESQSTSDFYLSDSPQDIYSPQFADINERLKCAVLVYCESATPAPLRILEIGAGFGPTTESLLRALASIEREYWFTDVSPYFIQQARERFADDPNIHFTLFDMDRSPLVQGLPVHTFDIVIASSVLHMANDVARTLKHILRLLKPAGLLLAIEETRHHPWMDLSMGLQPGFERFEDYGLRPAHPLLTPSQWIAIGHEQGFQQADCRLAEGTWEAELGIALLAAQAPCEARSFEAQRLRQRLAAELPDYMVPEQYYILDAWPLGATGKLDRKQLPQPQHDRPQGGELAPQGRLEQALAQVWRSLLGIEAIGRDDHFFELGGDSLLATRVTSRLRDAGFHLPLSQVFAEPVLHHQAQGIRPLEHSGILSAVQPHGEGTPVVWLHAADGQTQNYELLVKKLDPRRPHYVIGEDETVQPATLPRLAARYMRLIEERWAQGPIHLAGFSSGGVLAWLMAQQLEARGYPIEGVLLIDSQFGGTEVEQLLNSNALSSFALVHGLPSPDRALGHEQALQHLADAARCSLDLLQQRMQRFREQVASLPRRPELRLRTPITYIQALGDYGANAAQLTLWRQACSKPLSHHTIRVGHFDCFRSSGITDLAQIVDRALTAEARGSIDA